MFGNYRPSDTPLRWRLAGGTMMACFYCYFDPLSSPHHLKQNKKRKKKNTRQNRTPLTILSGSGHSNNSLLKRSVPTLVR